MCLFTDPQLIGHLRVTYPALTFPCVYVCLCGADGDRNEYIYVIEIFELRSMRNARRASGNDAAAYVSPKAWKIIPRVAVHSSKSA